ncbi:MAG TPA: hypothetical protein VGD65_11365, partial [Chryseosolibacter sp.]
DEREAVAYTGTHKLLIKTTAAENVLNLIARPNVAGLALDGTPELRPGFKDYTDLADILERLDED